MNTESGIPIIFFLCSILSPEKSMSDFELRVISTIPMIFHMVGLVCSCRVPWECTLVAAVT